MVRTGPIRAFSLGQAISKKKKITFKIHLWQMDKHLERKKSIDNLRNYGAPIRERLNDRMNYLGYTQSEVAGHIAKSVRGKLRVGKETLNNSLNDILERNLIERLSYAHKNKIKLNDTIESILVVYEWRFANFCGAIGVYGKDYQKMMKGIEKINPKWVYRESKVKQYQPKKK